MHKSLRWFIVFSQMSQFSDLTTTFNWTMDDCSLDS